MEEATIALYRSCLYCLQTSGTTCSTSVSSKNQSAYRSHHSCETALLNISEKWLKAMDNGDPVGTVFLDLSKAFDLVSHDILIAKLAKYHTRQVCSVSSVPSSPARLDRGVPRGSILGPHLSSVHMNDQPLLLKETEVDIYADDTTFLSSGKPVELPALKYNKRKMRVQAKRTAGLNSMKCNLTSKRPSTYSLVLLRSSSTVKKLHQNFPLTIQDWGNQQEKSSLVSSLILTSRGTYMLTI